MPVLQTSEVFSSEALSYIEEFGAKAGLLQMLRDTCPSLVNNILDGHYVAPENLSCDYVKDTISKNGVEHPFLRSTHPDDGVGYIGRLDNSEPNWVSGDMFTDIGLDGYSKRLGYRESSKTGLYIQEQLQQDDVVFGNLVEDPHTPGVFYISGRKRLELGTMAGLSKYGRKLHTNIFSEEIQTDIVRAYNDCRETGCMHDDISGQMEFAIQKNGLVRPLQLRAFRPKQKPTWTLDNTAQFGEESVVLGVTPEEGVLVNMGNSEGRFVEDFIDKSLNGFHKSGRDRWNNIHPDIPLEKMDCITADPGLSPFEHSLYEIACLSNIAIFSQYGTFDFPHKSIPTGGDETMKCRVFSDGLDFRIDIEG